MSMGYTFNKIFSGAINTMQLLALLIVALCYCSLSLANNNKSVLLVNPSIENDPFWHKTEQITQQAALELNLDLSIIYGNGTRFFQLQEIKKYFAENKAPDYIILMNYPGHAKVSMDLLQQHNVKVITLEQTLSKEERAQIGSPGGLYNNWLGEVYFNNKYAGFKLAAELINQIQKANKKPVVAGISGHYGSESSLRNSGLRSAVDESGAYLTQIVHAGWSAEDAYKKTLKLFKRYPDINILWCASDHMALGALKAIESLGLTPGKDVLIGGFDWTIKAIESINNKKLSASVGGHFMMGAIAMIAIYDIENDIPHQPFVNSTKNSFNLDLITKSNVQKHYDLLTLSDLRHIDFKKLAPLYSRQEKINTFNLLDMLYASTKAEN